MLEILKYLPMLLKYLPAILKGKDVSARYLADNGTEKPLLVSRRVVGVIVGVIASGLGMLSVYYGISIPDANVKAIIDTVLQLVALGISLYGFILSIIGDIKRSVTFTGAGKDK